MTNLLNIMKMKKVRFLKNYGKFRKGEVKLISSSLAEILEKRGIVEVLEL